MSFILDALKKSENERQQSSTHEFAAVPANPGAQTFPRWLLLIGLLLAINLIVLMGLLLRQDAENSEPAHVSLPAAVTTKQSDPATDRVQDSRQPSFEEQVASARQNPPARQTASISSAPETDSAPDVQADLISQNPSSVTRRQLNPTIQEIRASGALDLPDLHLDIHVYSNVPADRFVFINMAKHREGSRLDEGPQVSEITPDGVVLRYQGKSFLVPRE